MILGAYSYAVLSTVVGVAYPAFHSFKTLRANNSPDPRAQEAWLTYWSIYAIVNVLETVMDMVLAAWCPLYLEAKLVFLFWLVSPYTQASIRDCARGCEGALRREDLGLG